MGRFQFFARSGGLAAIGRMHKSTTAPGRSAQRIPRTFGRCSLLASIVLLCLAGCNRPVVSVPSTPGERPAPRQSAAPPASSNERATADFKHFALNALLVPLLEEDVPARYADPSWSVDCADADVTVDGARLDIGAPMPHAFTVRWRMDRCFPLGAQLELSGDVELVVRREGDTYSAIVRPEGLRVRSNFGVEVLAEPFAARLTDGPHLPR